MSDQIQSHPFHVSATAIGFRFLLARSQLRNSPNKMTRLGGHHGIDRYLQSGPKMSLKSESIVIFWVSRVVEVSYPALISVVSNTYSLSNLISFEM
jgi:hypothetical protein